MSSKVNINIDLVFICSQSVQNLNEFHNDDDKLIFNSTFWEDVFSNWVQIMMNENINNKSEILSYKKNFSLSFHITNNKEISSLNKKWLNKNGPTDVISFPILIDKEFEYDLLFIELGDLFISLEMAAKQAKDFRNSLKKEMLFLASHGFLHLLGWEHDTEEKLQSMLNLQEYLISKIN